MTDEQQKVVDEWEEKICAGVMSCHRADFTVWTILENREDDLRQMRKTSLEACFNRSEQSDKDVCRNFLQV